MKRPLTLGVGVGIGALAFAGVTLPGAAADLGYVVAAPIAFYNWTSCYLGGNLGGKWGSFTGAANVTGFSPVPLGPDVTGTGGTWDSALIGGGQVGCQYQSGSLVFGIEGDIGGSDIGRTFTFPESFVPPPGFPFVANDSVSFRSHWQASIRGRLGYALDRWLLYATAGVAFANLHMNVGLVPTAGLAGANFSDGRTATGGTVGAGFDYAFTDYLSVGMEYRYSKYGRENFFGAAPFPILGPTGLPATTPFGGSGDLQTHEITARLSWHLNLFRPGPIWGRYY
jgi:outer membrane immunogenic protein